MFGYAKKDLRKKINKLEQEMALLEKNEKECEDRIKYIDDYFGAKREIYNKKRINKIGALLIMFAMIGCIATPWMLIGVTLLSGLELYYVIDSIKFKKRIMNQYSDLSSLTRGQIIDERGLVKKKIFQYHCDEIQLISEYKKYLDEFRRIEKYKDMLSNVLNLKNPYWLADTEEEYSAMISMKEEPNKLLEKFLEEKIDYSQIHLDVRVCEEVEYKERPKQFIKKI